MSFGNNNENMEAINGRSNKSRNNPKNLPTQLSNELKQISLSKTLTMKKDKIRFLCTQHQNT